MKGLAKTAAVALAAVAGISSAVAAPDRATEGTGGVPQISGGTGLSFEDLRVDPRGKVRVGIGSTEVPVRVAGQTPCDITTTNGKSC
jgi:hypothetical protein